MGIKINLDDLIGETANYYGSKDNRNLFKLGEVVFQVVMDDCDEYRSRLSHVEEATDVFRVFEDSTPPTKVTVLEGGDNSTDEYKIVNEDGLTLLRFGTDNTDDYYPSFFYESFDPVAYSVSLKERIKR